MLVLTIVYSITKAIALAARILPGSSQRRNRIIINGTFHNPNWFFAHVGPIAQSKYGEVVLICDPPVGELPNLELRHPPRMARLLLTSAGARAVWTFIEGIRRPADIFVGYHIFPSAVTALICARLTGARAVYQMTSGPLELEGGGWHAENKLLVMLQRPSNLVESLAHSIMREFDLVVVRGSAARNYALQHGVSRQIEVVTGSVETQLSHSRNKDLDIVLVGRLTEYKRPDRFVRAIACVAKRMGEVKAAIVGTGPDEPKLKRLAAELGITGQLEFLGQQNNVPEILARTKIFVLTSRWEGVSIAMLEAMAMQAVPIVSDVGDLSDFVKPGVTGYLVVEDQIEQYASYIVELLKDDSKRERFAAAARAMVVEHCERQSLSRRWHDILVQVMEQR